jgi:SRSO17 transposase
LPQARIPPEVLDGMPGRLVDFAEPFCGLLWRKEQKNHLKTYLQGLLSDLASRNVESIAYLHDQDRICLQKFIGWSNWDHRPLMDELAQQVTREIGSPNGVIVFDPSAHHKHGPHSVGVKRQWCGRLGKIADTAVV